MNENEEEAWASIDHNYDAKKAEKENLKAQIDIDHMTVEHLRNALKLIVNKKLLKEKL